MILENLGSSVQQYATLFAALSAAASGVASLIAWGLREQVKALRLEIQLVRSEMQTELAQAENRFFQRVNGAYARNEMHRELTARVDRIEARLEELE